MEDGFRGEEDGWGIEGFWGWGVGEEVGCAEVGYFDVDVAGWELLGHGHGDDGVGGCMWMDGVVVDS